MKSPYEIAKEELALHIQEIPGNKDNPRILEYHKCTILKAQHDEVPWCSSFVNYCVNRSRFTGFTVPKETKSASARSWQNWGVSTLSPREGDIVVFERRNDGHSGHVGFVVSVQKDFITTLGGNQDNKVCIKNEPFSKLLCFRMTGGYSIPAPTIQG